jgi:predicted DNA-binding protein (MmcQ/YjbR family)
MEYDSLIAYLDRKPGAKRDMPFGQDALVFKVLDKMFALVAWQKEPLTISLKVDPLDAVILRQQYSAIKPGYHLNKKHWNTVTLDSSIPDKEITWMIDQSYTLVVAGMTRAKQRQLEEMAR